MLLPNLCAVRGSVWPAGTLDVSTRPAATAAHSAVSVPTAASLLELRVRDVAVGLVSGCVAKSVTAPVERVKLLLQTQAVSPQIPRSQAYTGILDCARRVYQQQGVLSFWRGNLANIVRYVPAQALNFAFKDTYKGLFVRRHDPSTHFGRFFLGNLAAGAAAGATAAVFVYPLDLARTRVTVDVGVGSGRLFNGMSHCIGSIYSVDGVRGLYRGFGASLLQLVVFRAAFFGGYDTSKGVFLRDSKHAPIWKSWVLAQSVTTIAGILAYPFDTVRRRMMMQSGSRHQVTYRNAMHCWRHVVATEGPPALFAGCAANVLRGSGGALVLVMYDEVKKLFLLRGKQ